MAIQPLQGCVGKRFDHEGLGGQAQQTQHELEGSVALVHLVSTEPTIALPFQAQVRRQLCFPDRALASVLQVDGEQRQAVRRGVQSAPQVVAIAAPPIAPLPLDKFGEVNEIVADALRAVASLTRILVPLVRRTRARALRLLAIWRTVFGCFRCVLCRCVVTLEEYPIFRRFGLRPRSARLEATFGIRWWRPLALDERTFRVEVFELGHAHQTQPRERMMRASAA